MMNEQPVRCFVPNEEKVYHQLRAESKEYIPAVRLCKAGMLGGGGATKWQLELLGLPYLAVGFPGRGTFLVKTTDALNALGVSEWVRAGLVFPVPGGLQLRLEIKNAKLAIKQGKSGVIFVRRDDVLRHFAEQAKATPTSRAPVQAAMPLPPPSASSLELTPVLNLLEEHRESLDRLNGAQAILFKEVQVIRKGLDLILKDLVGPSAVAG